MTAVAPQAGVPANPTLNGARFSFLGQIKSEWIKMFGLRSTWWVVGLAVLSMVGLSAIFAATLNSFSFDADGNPAPLAPEAGLVAVTVGMSVAQFIFMVLGVMMMTGEYSTGRIRAVLSAAPTRLPVLGAKAALLAVVAFAVGLVGVGLSWLVVIALAPSGAHPTLDTDGAWRAVLGMPLYLAGLSVIALGIGTILRSTAGAIAATIGLALLPDILRTFISADWFQKLVDVLPAQAGNAFLSGGNDFLSEGAALAVFLGWVVLALVGGGLLLKTRDA